VGYQGFRRLRRIIGAGKKKREERKALKLRLGNEWQEDSPAAKPLKSCLKTPESVPRNLRVRFEGVKSAWVPPSVRRKREEQSRLAKETWQATNSPSPSAILAGGDSSSSDSCKDRIFANIPGSEEMEGAHNCGIPPGVTESAFDISCQDESLERTDSILSAVSIEPLIVSMDQKEELKDVSCPATGESYPAPKSGHEGASSAIKSLAGCEVDAHQTSASESESSCKLLSSPDTENVPTESKSEGEQALAPIKQDHLAAGSVLPASQCPLVVSPEEKKEQLRLWEEIKAAHSAKAPPQQEDAPKLKTKFPLRICREIPKPANPPVVASDSAEGRRATWEEKGKWPADAWREKDPSLLTEAEKKMRDEEIAEETAEKAYQARAVAYWKSKAPVYPNNPAGTSKSHGMHKVSAVQPNTDPESLGDFPSLQSVYWVNKYSGMAASELVASQEQVEEQKRRWAELTGRQ